MLAKKVVKKTSDFPKLNSNVSEITNLPLYDYIRY